MKCQANHRQDSNKVVVKLSDRESAVQRLLQHIEENICIQTIRPMIYEVI
jgi:hypothetical protein